MLDTLPSRTRPEAAKDERRRVVEKLDELAAEVERRHDRIVVALGEPSSAALFHVARSLQCLASHVRAEIDGMEAPKETTR